MNSGGIHSRIHSLVNIIGKPNWGARLGLWETEIKDTVPAFKELKI